MLNNYLRAHTLRQATHWRLLESFCTAALGVNTCSDSIGLLLCMGQYCPLMERKSIKQHIYSLYWLSRDKTHSSKTQGGLSPVYSVKKILVWTFFDVCLTSAWTFWKVEQPEKKESSPMHGDLTDRRDKEIIEKVIIQRIEGGRDTALILLGLVQSVCLFLWLVIPSHPNCICFSLQCTLLDWRLGSFSRQPEAKNPEERRSAVRTRLLLINFKFQRQLCPGFGLWSGRKRHIAAYISVTPRSSNMC